MRAFVKLFDRLDQTTKTNEKVKGLVSFFEEADPKDSLWTIALLSGRRPKRTIKTAQLREWAAELSKIPLWLFEESYAIAGDLAETIALCLPPHDSEHNKSFTDWIHFIKSLKDLDEDEKKAQVANAWNQLNSKEKFIFNKLITGGFRVGVSQKLIVKALSKYTGVEENILAHRLMGNWTPDTTSFQELLLEANPEDDLSKPYPFYLAYALDKEIEELGEIDDWQIERKWDGIRGQIIQRKNKLFVWSRGEELMTDKFPEFQKLLQVIPNGTVLDGEIIPIKDQQILGFHLMQKRIGRKNLSKKILEEVPIHFIVYDLLEWNGKDIRSNSISERRTILEKLSSNITDEAPIQISPLVNVSTWDELKNERTKSKEYSCEGLMLKRKDSVYKTGRVKGDWWKWKVDPMNIDAVMIYAQSGHGRRANLFSDFTFAVWDGDRLVPFAKAYSGLTDAELREITSFVKKNTVDKFGPVRSVKAELVFELAFEGIQLSKRHKSGVALRFPRIKRWRKDKKPKEANTLEDLKSMI